GSHPAWFPVRPDDLGQRLAHNRWAVPQVMRALGLDVAPLRPVLHQVPPGFEGRFNFTPRPLQATIADLDPNESGTELIIAESETGSGKTEAALDWFFRLFQSGIVDSLYFALPTRVAAREIYRRIDMHLKRW